jgi:hypothetical protein
MQLAVALYNNTIGDHNELAFHRGDILTVLIENPHGLDGWWFCKHRDQYGLCPENRLQLISSNYHSRSMDDSTKTAQFPYHLSRTSVSSVCQ